MYRDNNILLSPNLRFNIESLFYNYNPREVIMLRLGSGRSELYLKLGTYHEERNGSNIKTYLTSVQNDFTHQISPGLEIKYSDSDYDNVIPLDRLDRNFNNLAVVDLLLKGPDTSNAIFVPSSGAGYSNPALWDKISLTPAEEEVKKYLKIISPEIENIALISLPENENKRCFIVKLRNIGKRVLLSTLGEGVNRMLNIILSLVNAKQGILLIDEIENGIHYSIHSKVWELIFTLSEELQVQVFATTHSWDCIDGFQRALNSFHDPSQCLLLRLSKREEEIFATTFNARELAIATRENIEVR
jgi:hypothetical protein